MANNEIIPAQSTETVSVSQGDLSAIFERCLNSVRPDMRDNPYILEGLRVLPVNGYRSAIGSFWNAVVDDLRNKIVSRSLHLFNKSGKFSKEIKTYEDFQDHVNDDQLIDGAYAIGVIGWEASKILKHAKETRHIFDGHPRSSEPSAIKVLAMMDDCIRYVLNEEYPVPIVDIDEYVAMLGAQQFDRNAVAVENALGSLPEIYKAELIHRLFSAYVHPGSTTVLRSNIEFVVPTLWQVLPKDVKIQIVQKVDQLIPKGDAASTDQGFAFVRLVNAMPYLSAFSRRYKIVPSVQKLRESLDKWKDENEAIEELAPYASLIPQEALSEYVRSIVHTYVGFVGHSLQFSRTDFYADEACAKIPLMIQAFDDRAAESFIECIKSSSILRERITNPRKMRRLRSLGNIVLERISSSFPEREILEALVDEDNEELFFEMLPVLEKSK